MLKTYREHAAERAALGIPPLPLDAKQVAELIELIKNPPAGEDAFLMDLLTHRVPPGVDDAAKVKASFLAAVAHGEVQVGLVSKAKATELLGTMVGGYNVHPLIELLDNAEVAGVAAEALKLCKAGPMPSGLPHVLKLRKKSPSPSSRCPVKPTPTTCRPRPMPGAAPTFRCTTWQC
jgi:hypothetical protein